MLSFSKCADAIFCAGFLKPSLFRNISRKTWKCFVTTAFTRKTFCLFFPILGIMKVVTFFSSEFVVKRIDAVKRKTRK